MSEFVHERNAHFVAKPFLIAFHHLPDVFEVENDLRRKRHLFFVREFAADKQTEEFVRFLTILEDGSAGHTFVTDGQGGRARSKIRRESGHRSRHFSLGQAQQPLPLHFTARWRVWEKRFST